MCCNSEDLRETAEWDGKGSRSRLVEKLQSKDLKYMYKDKVIVL
jgi:hypothetical protein